MKERRKQRRRKKLKLGNSERKTVIYSGKIK